MVTVGGLCHVLREQSKDETLCGLGGLWIAAKIATRPTKWLCDTCRKAIKEETQAATEAQNQATLF